MTVPRRRTRQRMVAGVAGGIADSLVVSVTFVRLVALAVVLFTGWFGIAAYALAALVLPARGRRLPDWDNVVVLGRLATLVAVQEVLLAEPVTLLVERPALWVAALGLAVVGAAALLSADYRREREATPAEARATVLGALTVLLPAAAIALGVVLAPDVRWDRPLPLVVVAAGAALVVGARAGRWRPLVAPAVVATAAVAVAVAADVRLAGGVGHLRVAPASADELPSIVQRAVGSVSVTVPPLEGTRRVVVRAIVGIGDVEVRVPPGADVVVDVRAGRGRAQVDLTQAPESGRLADDSVFEDAAGVDLDRTFSWPDRGTQTVVDLGRDGDVIREQEVDLSRARHPPRPTVHLVAEVGLGEIDVHTVGTRLE